MVTRTRCAVIARINIQPSTDQLHWLLHAGNTNTNFEPRLLFSSLFSAREPPQVADFQRQM